MCLEKLEVCDKILAVSEGHMQFARLVPGTFPLEHPICFPFDSTSSVLGPTRLERHLPS